MPLCDAKWREHGLPPPVGGSPKPATKEWEPGPLEYYKAHIRQGELTDPQREELEQVIGYLWTENRQYWEPESCKGATAMNHFKLERYLEQHPASQFSNLRRMYCYSGMFAHYWVEVDAVVDGKPIPVVIDCVGHTAFIGAHTPYIGPRPADHVFYSHGEVTGPFSVMHV